MFEKLKQMIKETEEKRSTKEIVLESITELLDDDYLLEESLLDLDIDDELYCEDEEFDVDDIPEDDDEYDSDEDEEDDDDSDEDEEDDDNCCEYTSIRDLFRRNI